MRRYVYIILAALITTTGCRMSSGETREPIEVGEYIAREVVRNYIGTQVEVERALIADWYLSTDDEVLRKDICDRFLPNISEEYEVHYENDTVRILYRYIYKPREEERVVVLDEFVTNGKLLSEGGEWSSRYGGIARCMIIGNEDGSYDVVNNSPLEEWDQDWTHGLHLSNVELDIESGIAYDIDGNLNAYYHDSTSDRNVYLCYETEITETLECRAYVNSQKIRFNSGAIHVVCDDKRNGKHDEVDIKFKKADSADVSYLNEVGTIEY